MRRGAFRRRMFPAGGQQAALSVTWQSALQWSLPQQGPAAPNVPHCISQLSEVLLFQVHQHAADQRMHASIG